MIKRSFLTSLIAVVMTLITTTVSYSQVKSSFIADRVIAIVGDRMILQSDLQMAEAYKKEGENIPFTEKLSDAEVGDILHQLMSQKLLSAQAQLDSIPVDDLSVFEMVEQRVSAMLEQYGSVQQIEEARRKPMYLIRDELFTQLKETYLAQMMTQTVQSKVIITPNEVKNIIKKLDKSEIPLIPEQYEYSEIVLKAPNTAESKNRVKDELLSMRERIMNGANFAALARLYSDDTESAKRGGELGYVTPEMLTTPFADAMMALTVGQVSGIVETEFGFHIIQLIDKQGGRYNCRHILLRNKFDPVQIEQAINRLDSIGTEIKDDKITFEQAAITYSEHEDSKAMEGVAVNGRNAANYGAKTKSTKFFIDDLQGDYEMLKDLKEGEVSKAFTTYDNSGNLVCKIVRLNNRIAEHPADMKQDFSLLSDLALNIKRQEEFEKWLDKQKQKMYVRVEAPYNSYITIVENWSK